MATLDEIFASMPDEAAEGTHELLVIDADTRQIYVPESEEIFGVENDGNAVDKYFLCPRYVGKGIDLASCFLRVNFQNANGERDGYLVKDTTIDGEYIRFTWELSKKVTQYKGTVQFVLCASLPGSTKTADWHTTLAQGISLEGLEPDAAVVEAECSDLIAQLLAVVAAQEANVEAVGAAQVKTVEAAAKAAQQAAVAEIEAKKQNALAELPADYTEMANQVDKLIRSTAGAIVCQAEGETIQVADASDNFLPGLRIFGKSTQDGTPTPEAPVEIVSTPAPVVRVCGRNLLLSTAKTVEKNGVTFTVNADGSVTVNGTATAAATLYLTTATVFPAGNYILTGCPAGGADTLYDLRCGVYRDYGNGKHFTLTEDMKEAAAIMIRSGASLDSLTFYPMLQLAENAADEYEPYNGQTITLANGLPGIPVASGGNYTDADGQQWICDEVDLGQGVYVQRIYTLTLAGTETFVNITGDYATPLVKPAFDSQARVQCFCDHFPAKSRDELTALTKEAGALGASANFSYVRFVDNANYSQPDVDGFKAFLAEKYAAGTPVTVKYILAEPIETPLSEVELAAFATLHSNKPTTTILNDSGARMAVEYVADTKLYIDGKLAELVAAMNA